MTAQTHKQFCIWTTYFGIIYMYANGLNSINYYIMLYIMLKISVAGALFPDVDHHWQNVKEKTITNWIINKIIHITGGKHRSWQTHSWDICLGSWIGLTILSNYLLKINTISKIDHEVLKMIIIAFYLGWISHLISDMLTSAGVRVFCFLDYKIKLVPRKLNRFSVLIVAILSAMIGMIICSVGILAIGIVMVFIGIFLFMAGIKLGNITFNTGKEWEMFVYKASKVINLFMGIFTLIFPLVYNTNLLAELSHII